MNKLESWKSLERNGEKPSEIAAFENAVSARRGKVSQIPHKPYIPNRTSSENTIKLFSENHHDKSISTFSDDLSPDKGTGIADYTHSDQLYPQPAGNFIHKAPRKSANRIIPRAMFIYSTEIDKR